MKNEPPPREVGSNLLLGQLPARWYCINSRGVATLCVDESDAKANAANCDKLYPAYAPHRAVLLGDVAAERERCADICMYGRIHKARPTPEQLATVRDGDEEAMTRIYCAAAIRGA